jgi:hypothetical protein
MGPPAVSSALRCHFLHVMIILLSLIQSLMLLPVLLSTTRPLKERSRYQGPGAVPAVHHDPRHEGNTTRPRAEEHPTVGLIHKNLLGLGKPKQNSSRAAPLPSPRVLYAMAPYGPSNQIFGLQEVSSMAGLLNRTLIFPIIR